MSASKILSARSRASAALLFSALLVGPAQAATITVTTTADEYNSGASCSLREAITAANNNAAFGGCPAGSGTDTISVPAGTYTLTLANAGGINEDNNATGDLDVLSSLTIQGAGAGLSIIQAGTNTSNGIDKVFGLNPFCSNGVSVAMDGVTVRYGRNTQVFDSVGYSHTGGGVDWCGEMSGVGSLTISNASISDNTNTGFYGGGLNLDSLASYSGLITVSNVTFANNRTLSTTNQATGGALNIFGASPQVVLSNCTFQGNSTPSMSDGGAIYYRPSFGGSLTVENSTFSGNSSGRSGGGLATYVWGAGTTVAVRNSTFAGNVASSAGAAMSLGGADTTVSPFLVTGVVLVNGSAGTNGGGVYVGNANVTIVDSRIVNNTAPGGGTGLYKDAYPTTVTAANNWWGCSTGPSSAPCDTVATAGLGTLTSTPFRRDQLTASPGALAVNQSAALTASFLTNSAGTAVPVASLAPILGLPVTWGATSGSLTGTQATVQPTGTATGSFRPSAAGSATIYAKVDNDGTSGVGSNVLSVTVAKAGTTTAITSALPDPSVVGQAVTVLYSVTGAFGSVPTAPAGNITVSDGTDTCTGTAAAGSCAITLNAAGVRTLTATYAGDANFTGSTSPGVSHTVNGAPAITSVASTAFTVGVAGTFTVTTTGFPTGSSMLISATGSLPSGVTLTDNGNGTATLAGTPTVGAHGSYPITLTASNGVAPNAQQSFTLTVNRPSTSVSSIARTGPAVTNASSVSWTVTFANATQGLGSSNFSVVAVGLGGAAAVTGVTPSGALPTAVWTVSVSTGTGTGTLGLNLTSDTGIAHAISNAPFVGEVVTLDRTAPTVNTFSATSPSSSLAIPITGFTASDNVGVTGYIITQSAAAPSASDSGWSGSAPTTYTVGGVGTYTLYPWAKDGLGNVSVPFGSPVAAIVCSSSPMVTSVTDSGPGSLREALANACSGGTITFDGSLAGQAVLLSSQLELGRDVTIDGSGLTSQLVISGQHTVRAFVVNTGVVASLQSLTMVDGAAAGADGGAILNQGTATLTNCTVSGSSAANGGGVYNLSGALMVVSSTLTGNSSTASGGGVSNHLGILALTNSTLAGNNAGGQGGGIYSDGTLTITNSTVSGNGATIGGGGLFNASGGTLHYTNTVIANSSPGADCEGSGAIGTNASNLVESGSCSAPLSGDPLLGALGNYGGATRTLAALPGSPVIDAGTSSGCPATDQRGSSRPQGSGCDIGAFESRGFSQTKSGGDNQVAGVGTPFGSPLALTVASAHGEPVDGGRVTLTAPSSGASTSTAVYTLAVSGGAVSQLVAANGVVGAYSVTASAAGAGSTAFNLRNLGLPLVTWSSPADIPYGTALGAAQLNATADVPGSFAYSPAAGTVLTVGTHTLRADFTPSDAANYATVSKEVSINVLGGGFYSLSPCRAFDTRAVGAQTTGSPLNPGESKVFTVVGLCGIPVSAGAVAINATVVNGTAPGHISIIAGDRTSSTTSLINFPVGRARANNAVVQLAMDGAGTIRVINGSLGTVHLILDVSGYFE